MSHSPPQYTPLPNLLSVIVLTHLPNLCRCRGLVLQLIIHNHNTIGRNSSCRGIGLSQRPLPDNTQQSQQISMPSAGSNPQPQRACGRRPTPLNVLPLVIGLCPTCTYKNVGFGRFKAGKWHRHTVIPRLTKIIRSGITFVNRNVMSHRFLQKIV